jgi:hypothetical protein
MRALQGLRQKLLQTESALREAQAKRDAEAASCAAMAERLQAGSSTPRYNRSSACDLLQNKWSRQNLRRSCGS